MKIREATANDAGTIRKILLDAFGGEEEALLVPRLLQAGLALEGLSLLAEIDGKPVGYLLFTKMSVEGKNGRNFPAVAVAPLGVMADYQGKGVGSQLMERGLSLAEQQGHSVALLMGNPAYYHRFGFETSTKYGIDSPFDVEDRYYMVKFFRGMPEENQKGTAVYPPAWEE